MVPLLPFLERGDVYDGVANGQIWSCDYNNYSSGQLLSFTKCPSLSLPVAYPAWTTYRVNAGGGYGSPFNSSDGVFGDQAAGVITSLADVNSGDGLSTTLMMAESVGSSGQGTNWTPVIYTVYAPGGEYNSPSTPGAFKFQPCNAWCRLVPYNSGFNLVFGLPGVSSPATAPVAATQKIINGGKTDWPNSPHSGGAFVAFADGHMKFLSDALPPHVYGHLVTSRSAWNGSSYATNSARANTYLLSKSGSNPYQLDDKDY